MSMLTKNIARGGFLILGFLVALNVGAKSGEEVHIFPDGKARLVGEVVLKNAANIFKMRIWGQYWRVTAFDYPPTKLISKDGESLQLDEIQVGHILDVEGFPAEEAGVVDARVIRDISIMRNQNAKEAVLKKPVVPKSVKKPNLKPPSPSTATPLRATTTIERMLRFFDGLRSW